MNREVFEIYSIMKNFKLWRNTTLITAVFFLFIAAYVVFAKFEKPYVCSLEPSGYGAYTMIQYFIDLKDTVGIDNCDIKDLPTGFWIIPLDFLSVFVVSGGMFVYLQWFYKSKHSDCSFDRKR